MTAPTLVTKYVRPRDDRVVLPPSIDPDDFIVVCGSQDGDTDPAPSGWIKIARVHGDGDTQTLYALGRVADGTEDGSLLFPGAGDNTFLVYQYRGVDTTAPIGAISTNKNDLASGVGSDATLTVSGVTTGVADSIVFALFGGDVLDLATTAPPLYTYTTPSGFSNKLSNEDSYDTLCAFDQVKTVAGASGSVACTMNTQGIMGLVFVINPVSSGGSGVDFHLTGDAGLAFSVAAPYRKQIVQSGSAKLNISSSSPYRKETKFTGQAQLNVGKSSLFRYEKKLSGVAQVNFSSTPLHRIEKKLIGNAGLTFSSAANYSTGSDFHFVGNARLELGAGAQLKFEKHVSGNSIINLGVLSPICQQKKLNGGARINLSAISPNSFRKTIMGNAGLVFRNEAIYTVGTDYHFAGSSLFYISAASLNRIQKNIFGGGAIAFRSRATYRFSSGSAAYYPNLRAQIEQALFAMIESDLVVTIED